MDANDLVNGVPYSWLPAYGEAIESNNQNNRSNILETILEETSDDEDSGRWNNIGRSWTTSDSNSENQSVIEVDVNQGICLNYKSKILAHFSEKM